MAGGVLRWVQGAVDEGAGGLFLAGEQRVYRRRAGQWGCSRRGLLLPRARPGGEPQGQRGVAQIAGTAGEWGGGQAGAEYGGGGGVPGAAVGAFAEEDAALQHRLATRASASASRTLNTTLAASPQQGLKRGRSTENLS
jgi:hypothetical protein